jgi:hypothetical protein
MTIIVNKCPRGYQTSIIIYVDVTNHDLIQHHPISMVSCANTGECWSILIVQCLELGSYYWLCAVLNWIGHDCLISCSCCRHILMESTIIYVFQVTVIDCAASRLVRCAGFLWSPCTRWRAAIFTTSVLGALMCILFVESSIIYHKGAVRIDVYTVCRS